MSVERMESDIHHRDTENTEGAQRLEFFSLCPLCVLCVSVVNALLQTLNMNRSCGLIMTVSS
jgi:hypothetical protein